MNNNNVFFHSEIDYNKMTDEEIIDIAKTGNKQALDYLINKYRDLVNLRVNKYYIIGAEKEDIIQEGLIGLFKAIKSYKSGMQNSFKTFASICIERQLITAIKTSNRQKHIPLNSYLSLNMNAYDSEQNDNDTTLLEIYNNATVEDPLDTLTKKEYYNYIENAIENALSDFEKKVLFRYIKGESYNKIAEELDTPVKSIDNAIQRIRKKAIKEIPEI